MSHSSKPLFLFLPAILLGAMGAGMVPPAATGPASLPASGPGTATAGTAPAAGCRVSTTMPDDSNKKSHGQWYIDCEKRVADMKGKPCEIIFIGDSITENFSTRDSTPAFDMVGKAVWEKYYGKRKALNFGVGADRTESVLWRLENMDIKGLDPKVAVVMIGTNNTTNTPEEIAAGVKAVLAATRVTFKRAKVILVSILPSARAAQKMEEANKLIEPLADEKTIFYLDVAAKMTKEGSSWKGLGRDRLHLSPEGYELWASAMEPLLVKLLEAQ